MNIKDSDIFLINSSCSLRIKKEKKNPPCCLLHKKLGLFSNCFFQHLKES